jgi:hypothetical protein
MVFIFCRHIQYGFSSHPAPLFPFTKPATGHRTEPFGVIHILKCCFVKIRFSSISLCAYESPECFLLIFRLKHAFFMTRSSYSPGFDQSNNYWTTNCETHCCIIFPIRLRSKYCSSSLCSHMPSISFLLPVYLETTFCGRAEQEAKI